MSTRIDRASLFRSRLAEALARSGLSQSALARAAGVDRSTISALLAPGTRLPNAPLVADCAAALAVSCDWLLGLAADPGTAETALQRAIRFSPAQRALFDEAILAWHSEAAGYKVRHVPASLPDMLKTPGVAEWEYRDHLLPDAGAALEAFERQRQWLRAARSDYEIALPLHEIDSFAAGTGYWQGLPADLRRAQLTQLIGLCDALYPALRLYLYDARRVFSAPLTIFGPLHAVVYLGQDHISFRDPSQVARLTRHFDGLVRHAAHEARQAAPYLAALRDQLP